VLQQVGLTSSAILAHIMHYAEALLVADGGKDTVLVSLGCALHRYAQKSPI